MGLGQDRGMPEAVQAFVDSGNDLLRIRPILNDLNVRTCRSTWSHAFRSTKRQKSRSSWRPRGSEKDRSTPSRRKRRVLEKTRQVISRGRSSPTVFLKLFRSASSSWTPPRVRKTRPTRCFRIKEVLARVARPRCLQRARMGINLRSRYLPELRFYWAPIPGRGAAPSPGTSKRPTSLARAPQTRRYLENSASAERRLAAI